MKKRHGKMTLALLLSAALGAALVPVGREAPQRVAAAGEFAVLAVDPTQAEGTGGSGVHEVSDSLYGIFFEDINHGADGGLSAEMVVNQSFEYAYINYSGAKAIVADNQRFWNIDSKTTKFATKALMNNGGMSANNPNYLKITAKVGGYRLYNAGFQGDDFNAPGDAGYNAPNLDDYAMSFIEGGQYLFSFYAKQDKGAPYKGSVEAYALNREGTPVTTKCSLPFSEDTATEWTKYSAVLNATGTDLGALYIDFQGKGTVCVDFFSLMPTDAYGMNDARYSGGKIRRSVLETLQNMHPTFLRFPGGCVAEGDVSWENVYNWKHTVGPLEERIGTPNTWEYWQSYNIGFYEYFLLCEDLAMKPMPVVSAGLICQARMGETGALMYRYDDPLFKDEVVDQVLHLIYFVKGNPSSDDPNERKWASLRAEMGHPEPFEMELISLGNENWGEVYWENFAAAKRELEHYAYGYYDAKPQNMLEKWGITLVTTSGTAASGAEFNRAWRKVNGASPQSATEDGLYRDLIVDEHYYASPDWYRSNTSRYDSYDRSGAKVFLGEYSANGGGAYVNTLEGALAEAAFMTGLERNSDVVVMASLAPLFGKWGNSNWATNTIWMNAKNIALTPNYFVQQMFAEHVGDRYIPAAFSVPGCYQSVTQDTQKNRIIVKLVNTTSAARSVSIDLTKVSGARGYYFGKTMQSDDQSVRNEPADAYDGDVVYRVRPEEVEKTSYTGGAARYAMEKYSVSVLVFPCGEESADSSLSDIKLYGATLPGFSPEGNEYAVRVEAGQAVPYLFATAADSRATVEIKYAASLSDVTLVTVRAENGTETVYRIRYETDSGGEPSPPPDSSPAGCGCATVTGGGGGTVLLLTGLSVLLLAACLARSMTKRNSYAPKGEKDRIQSGGKSR